VVLVSTVDPRGLVGTWTFDRVVTDHLAGDLVRVRGTVEFSNESDASVLWSERGTMERGATTVDVQRVLHVVPRAGEPVGASGWDVTFEDGREFHPWQPERWVEHLCGADTYRGLVEFPDPDTADAGEEAWTLTWRVSGPRKDYEMVTRLRRPSV
jgi:hypothetical protein